jgi:hypothetical protein
MPLTNATLSKPPVRLGGGHGWWGVLDLRGGRGARLAHRIGAMHGGGGGRIRQGSSGVEKEE